MHTCLPFCFFEVRVLFMSDHYTSALHATNRDPPPLSDGSGSGPSPACLTAMGAVSTGCQACVSTAMDTASKLACLSNKNCTQAEGDSLVAACGAPPTTGTGNSTGNACEATSNTSMISCSMLA